MHDPGHGFGRYVSTRSFHLRLFMMHIDRLSLTEETWQYFMTKSGDTNVFYFFHGFEWNDDTRLFLVNKFMKDYDTVRIDFLQFRVSSHRVVDRC